MGQFPWQSPVIEDSKAKTKDKKKEAKTSLDQEVTGLRYVPWLFKTVKDK